ncbi:MAG: S8 family serine peptidase [Saprospiraceae bacterium]|nr:S8 family serine peptidase [Saprospiraceae bacterium]
MTKKLNKISLNYGGIKISLSKSKTDAAVQYLPGTKKTTGKKANRDAVAAPPIEGFEVVRSKRGIDQKLDQLRARPDVAVGTHVWNFDGEDDTPFVPTGNLYVEFDPKASAEKQREILETLHLNIKEIVGTGAYRVSVTPASPNPMRCAMDLQKNKLVRVAEPELATLPAPRAFIQPSGQFVSTQWHLENTGQSIPAIDVPNSVYAASHFKAGADAKVRAAWNHLQSLGSSNIRIAVIDTGFALDHPQLRGDGTKIRNPFNAATRTADVSPYVMLSDGTFQVYSHGTSCAAVAAGALDNQGVLGAAPLSRIIPIKLDVLSDEAIRNAFEHAALNGADVISCSLGYPKPVPLSTYITNYIRQVATNGRGGKGLPIFFAAGNANPASNNQPRPISDFAAHPSVICITASNSLDQRSDYSFYGDNTHNCAPTNGNAGVGITTATVDLDTRGQSLVLTYTSGFGGTSSATPLAAGVCALMLSANPNLTLEDIRRILRQSADKIGSGYDSNGHSPYYGFGRINALRAVQAANAMKTGGMSGTSTGAGSGAGSAALRGRVVSKFLNVRSGPGTTFAKVAELKQGDLVNLLEKVSTFWRIGAGQFVSADFVQILQSAPAAPVSTPKGRVNNSFLNVRSGPGVNFPKVGELKMGDVVPVLETTTDGWMRIGDGKWVLGKFVQMV